ncbi:NF-X1-type zinc finger protein NFXL2 [Citrus sinensis]|uniref:NF-X1-type zinc finger protein NFXL2 n=1 Tax=Citrus sinensis TaxID=2711 RepID=A0ACB8L1H1_CITSI|nr:NF-X1-type zinc finger protein NFXL2 [Citrus sinensis]
MTSSANYQQILSDSDTDSDNGRTESFPDLSSSILKPYLESTNQSSLATSQSPSELSKIKSFLASSSSGALSCLICLERIKPSDPTWHCSTICYSIFHLICIQSWARQSSDLSASLAASRLPITAEKAAESSTWNCPKCRSQYSKSQIPKKYLCFCGKLEDPYSEDPWILPHSCNEICNRPLQNNCGHFCLLLCHPGPCPPCPKLVNSSCFCRKFQEVRRCGFKSFSCNKICSKPLDCRTHKCLQICHEGPCPPCKARAVYMCRCGRVEEERECCERDFRCENACGKALDCGKHVCERGCHVGQCGGCPLQGKRTCPCGKRVYEGMSCDVAVPLCGATCDKMLSCRIHRCHDRCHRGPCIETCRMVIAKLCRCRSLKKECKFRCNALTDTQVCSLTYVDVCKITDLVCERKCQRMRDCGRHACKRRCCNGDCPPCSEPHKCHYGACPPCRLICEEEYPCGHSCKLRCHGPRPPPNPEFTLKTKKKKSNHQSEVTPGSPCPPCPELIWRSCVGEHIGAERMMVCSDRTQFSCDNLCGNPLPCGNHYCTKYCHALKSQSSLSVEKRSAESCEVCSLPCQKERMPTCPHSCPLPCHPGECPPCKVLVKRSCHCGSMVHVFECIYFNTLSEKEQMAARSCGGPCHRKLPYCTHLCPEICHPGQCPLPEQCCKKVTVRCVCQTLKKEWHCLDVQAAYRNIGRDPKDISKNQFGLGLLRCNSDCKSKVQVVDSVLQSRKPKVEEKEPATEKHVGKRRKRRERVRVVNQASRLQRIFTAVKWLLLFVTLSVAVAAGLYYGYKGLLKLSDWMNEVEEQRQRKRFPRI